MPVELEMTLKDAQALAGLLKLAREQEKFTDKVKGTGKAFKDTEKEIDRTAAAAKALIATPLEKLKAKEDQLTAAFKAGKLTVDEKARALEVYKQKILSAESATEKLGAATRGSGRDVDSAFSPSKIAAYVAGMGVATQVAQKFGEILQHNAELQKMGAESLKGEYAHMVTLNQLSSSPEQLQERYGVYEKLRSRHGLSDEQAAMLQEAAIAAGNESTIERFARTPGAGPAGERMKYASKLEALSGGQIDEVQADAMIKAAADPSMVSPAELAKYTPSAGAMMQAQGAAPAEVLGAMSVLADTLKGPEAAADRLNNLQVAMALDPRFRGKGLMGGVEALQALPAEERTDFMGKAEGLNIAYEQLTQNRQLIDQRIRAVREAGAAVGTDRDPILASQRQFEAAGGMAPVQKFRETEQRQKEVLRGAYGQQRLAAETRAMELSAEDVEMGRPGLAVGAAGVSRATALTFGAGERTVEAASHFGRLMTPMGLYDEISRRLGFAGENSEKATSELQEQTKILRDISGKLNAQPAARPGPSPTVNPR